MVAGAALGRLHLFDVHRHVFRGAHGLDTRTDSALADSFADERSIQAIHYSIRKSAHFTEYFIFCLLLYRGFRGDHKGWRWAWGLAALFCAAGYSVLDEIHQAFVASRTASAYDSLLGSIGAFAAFSVLWNWFHWRRSTGDAPHP